MSSFLAPGPAEAVTCVTLVTMLPPHF